MKCFTKEGEKRDSTQQNERQFALVPDQEQPETPDHICSLKGEYLW